MVRDFYGLLDVPADADEEEIRAAFREKSREFHPDVNDDERANEQFKTVRRARDVLTDPEERAAYDRLGHEAYVARRMGGLPTFGRSRDGDRGSEDAGGARTGRGASRDDGERGRESDAAPDGDRYGSGAAFRGRRRRQRAARRRRRLVAEVAALAAATTYLLGLATFLHASGGVGFPATGPAEYARTAVGGVSPALAFPVGATAFPLGVGAAAVLADRRRGALVALAACGPLAAVAGAAGGAGGPTAWLVGLVAAPAAAIGGALALAALRRG